MKQSFYSHFDRDLARAGSANLNEAVRRGLLSQHEAMIHDHQWAQFSIYAKESHEVDVPSSSMKNWCGNTAKNSVRRCTTGIFRCRPRRAFLRQ